MSVVAGVEVVPRRVDQAAKSVVRSTAGSAVSGSGRRTLAVGDERRRVGLDEAAPDEHVLDEAAQPLLARQPPAHRARARAA